MHALRLTGAILLAGLLAGGCGEGEDMTDAGVDAGMGMDGGGNADAGGEDDGGAQTDAGVDAGPPESPLSDDEIAGLCGELCARATTCDTLDMVGGASCADECAARFEGDPTADYAATVSCVQSAACGEFADCLGTIPDVEQCDTACSYVASCGYGQLLEIENMAVCVPFCRGAVFSEDAETIAVTGCFAALSPTCSVADALDCIGELPSCEDMVADFEALSCETDSPLGAVFADGSEFAAHCESLTPSQRARTMICVRLAGCDGHRCHEIPEDVEEACVTGCETLTTETCESALGFSGEMCAAHCSGIHGIPDSHDVSAFATCAEDLTECLPAQPEDDLLGNFDDTYNTSFQYCMIQPSAEVTQACEDLIGCGLYEGTQVECEIDYGRVDFVGMEQLWGPSYDTCITESSGTTMCNKVASCTLRA
jgi:hypothetical protein